MGESEDRAANAPAPAPMPGRRALFHLCGALSAAAWGILAWQSHARPTVPLAVFVGVMLCAWGLYLLARRFAADSHHPWLPWILWALVFRAIAFIGQPVYEDDFYRYLWDGRSVVVAGNPYTHPPADSFGDITLPERFQRILDHINNPDLPTIYGPGAELVFAAGYLVAPGRLWPLKLAILLADLALLWLLFRRFGAANASLYAWCPLLLHESLFNAHFDILAIALAVFALLAADRRRWMAAGIWLALSFGVRHQAVLIAPFLLWRGGWRTAAGFGMPLAFLYGWFLLNGGDTEIEVMLLFAQDWEFNSSIYALLAAILPASTARAVCGLILAGVCAAIFLYWHREPTRWPRGDLLFAALLLLSPVSNPWYWMWLLPFAVAFPARWSVAALGAVSLAHIHGITWPESGLPPYHHPAWLRPLEFGIILVVAVLPYVSRVRTAASPSRSR